MGKDVGRMAIQMDEPRDCERAEIDRRDSHAILICDKRIAGERLAFAATSQNGGPGGEKERSAARHYRYFMRAPGGGGLWSRINLDAVEKLRPFGVAGWPTSESPLIRPRSDGGL